MLEALRTPLEDGEIRLARRDGVARYPARFQLVLAANPCPCAPPDPLDCICTSAAKRRYLCKLSGPLLDRVDLRVEMHRRRRRRFAAEAGESTAEVRARVAAARAAAAHRWRAARHPDQRRSQRRAAAPQLPADPKAMDPLRTARRPRGAQHSRLDRTLRVAWTLADLAGRTSPEIDDVTTALSFRQFGGAAMMTPRARAWAYLSRVAEPPCPELADSRHPRRAR